MSSYKWTMSVFVVHKLRQDYWREGTKYIVTTSIMHYYYKTWRWRRGKEKNVQIKDNNPLIEICYKLITEKILNRAPIQDLCDFFNETQTLHNDKPLKQNQ